MDPGDTAGGGGEIGPAQALELVGIPGAADLLEKEEAVGAALGGGAGIKAWGKFSTEKRE